MGKNKIFVLPSGQGKDFDIKKKPQTACKAAHIFKPLVWMFSISATMKNADVLCDEQACSCTDVEISSETVKRKAKGKFRRGVQIFYMVTVHTITWTMTLKMWTCLLNLGISLDNLNSQLYVSLLLITSTSSILTTGMMFKFSSHLPNIPPKLCRIRQLHGIAKELSLSFWGKLGGLVFVLLLLLMVVTCFGVLLKPNLLSLLDAYMAVIVCPFHNDTVPHWSFVLRLWYNLSNGFSFLGIYLTWVIFAWFCRTVFFLFDQCTLKLRQSISCKPSRFPPPPSLRQVVELHRDICELLCLGNDMFKHFFLSVYSMTLPSICFNMNILLKTKPDSYVFILAAISGVIMTITLLLIVIPTSITNAKVSQVREELYKLNVKEVDGEDFMLANFFASRLTSSTPGFTVADILVIDKGHILTLLSILVSYTVLLVQFNPSTLPRLGNINNGTMR